MKYIGSIGLALALALSGVVAACGPATPEPQNPPVATGEPTATAPPNVTAVPTATVAPTASVEPTATAPTATVAPTASTPPVPAVPPGPPIMATKMAEDLKKIGLELGKLPPAIEKMTDGQKKKVMALFVKSLGYEDCKGCHDSDFKKRTRNTNIAKHMWNDFVVGFKDDKGGNTVFCDSCHQGKPKILNRADNNAVQKFMRDQYVNHMGRADKKTHDCNSCHGDTYEMKIFDKLWTVGK